MNSINTYKKFHVAEACDNVVSIPVSEVLHRLETDIFPTVKSNLGLSKITIKNEYDESSGVFKFFAEKIFFGETIYLYTTISYLDIDMICSECHKVQDVYKKLTIILRNEFRTQIDTMKKIIADEQKEQDLLF